MLKHSIQVASIKKELAVKGAHIIFMQSKAQKTRQIYMLAEGNRLEVN